MALDVDIDLEADIVVSPGHREDLDLIDDFLNSLELFYRRRKGAGRRWSNGRWFWRAEARSRGRGWTSCSALRPSPPVEPPANLVFAAARSLGLERSHFYKKCRQLGIDLRALRPE